MLLGLSLACVEGEKSLATYSQLKSLYDKKKNFDLCSHVTKDS